MKASRRAVVIAAAALAVVVGAAMLVYSRFGSGVDDPESARCPNPPITTGATRSLHDHVEIDSHFTCEGEALAGTVYLPLTSGRHPGVVWVHGGGEALRLGWGGDILPGLVRAGVVVFSYDKRGVGASGGKCCPGDTGHFNLLTADVVGAVSVLRHRPEVDPGRVGLAGASQAGWIAPRAANQAHVAFVALASAPAIPERIANLYERLSRGDEGRLSKEEISRRLRAAKNGGFDPLPDLEQMTMPSLWEFGTQDDRTPVDESRSVLEALKAKGKDITIVVFPNAGHGLLDVPPTDPTAPATMIDWVTKHSHQR
jgi:dienelactone hydrolase